jgi:hypothetical protein
MRFSPRTHIADVPCCPGCTACRDTADVRSQARTYGYCVVGKPYFHQTSLSSYFPCFRVFFTDLENLDLLKFLETLIDLGEF